MISVLVLPYFSKYIDRTNEKQKMVTVLTAISELRQSALSDMVIGEIDVSGHDLIFSLDNRVIKRLTLPEPPAVNHVIYFNRFGMASGGEILIKFKKYYKIVIEEASGKITVLQS